MERLLQLTTPRAQLLGSIVVIVAILALGFAALSMLGEASATARVEAEQKRSRAWVGSVVDGPRDEFADSDLIEFSDRARFGTDETVALYTVRDVGRPIATAVKLAAPKGYNGAIEIAVAADLDGALLKVRVLSHAETPGFGDVIGDADSTWLAAFRGRSLESPTPSRWRLRGDGGDIDGISGATITASAVASGIFRALGYIQQSRTENLR